MRKIIIPPPTIVPDAAATGLQLYHARKNSVRQLVQLRFHTVSFVMEGTKRATGSRATTTLGPDDFLVVPAGRCLMSETVSDAGAAYRSLLLYFSPEALARVRRQLDLPPGAEHDAQLGLRAFRHDAFTRSFLTSLEALVTVEPGRRERLLKVKLVELLLYLSERDGPESLSALLPRPAGADLSAVVEANKYERLTLEELAFLCNVSVSTFKRAFRVTYGMPPARWFTHQRLAYAAFLLTGERLRPSEVYLRVGYESLSSFTQAFRTRYGVTPRRYARG